MKQFSKYTIRFILLILIFVSGTLQSLNAQSRYKHLPRIRIQKNQQPRELPSLETKHAFYVQQDVVVSISSVDSMKTLIDQVNDNIIPAAKSNSEFEKSIAPPIQTSRQTTKKDFSIGLKHRSFLKKKILSPSPQKTMMAKWAYLTIMLSVLGAICLLLGFLFAYGVVTWGAGIFGPFVTGILLIVLGGLCILGAIVLLILGIIASS